MKFNLTFLILIISIQNTFCADQTPKTSSVLELVRQCFGLETVTPDQAATLSYDSRIRKLCPALEEFNKELNGTERCIGRETAHSQGWTTSTWGEFFWTGTGPYKYASNRSEAAALTRDPKELALARQAWCIIHPLGYTPPQKPSK